MDDLKPEEILKIAEQRVRDTLTKSINARVEFTALTIRVVSFKFTLPAPGETQAGHKVDLTR